MGLYVLLCRDHPHLLRHYPDKAKLDHVFSIGRQQTLAIHRIIHPDHKLIVARRHIPLDLNRVRVHHIFPGLPTRGRSRPPGRHCIGLSPNTPIGSQQVNKDFVILICLGSRLPHECDLQRLTNCHALGRIKANKRRPISQWSIHMV